MKKNETGKKFWRRRWRERQDALRNIAVARSNPQPGCNPQCGHCGVWDRSVVDRATRRIVVHGAEITEPLDVVRTLRRGRTQAVVVLSLAFKDGNKMNDKPENLLLLCQKCRAVLKRDLKKSEPERNFPRRGREAGTRKERK